MEKKKSAIAAAGPFLLAIAAGIAAAWIGSPRHPGPEDGTAEEPAVPAPAGAGAEEPPAAPMPAAYAEEAPAGPVAALPGAEPRQEPPPREPPAEPVPPAPAAPAGPGAEAVPPGQAPPPRLLFDEIWAYILPGEEKYLSPAKALTDLGLFDFSLDHAGRLQGKANEAGIARAAALGIRTHLVIASSGNRSLLHLAVTPRYGVRKKLIEAISRLPLRHRVQGVQLDLEGPSPEERQELAGFIGELRDALPPGCVLSLALPAKSADEPAGYVYADLPGLADRFFLMVYDQHWKGGPPGPISDLPWHEAVLACAAVRLPPDAVIVGMPFYGRVWQREEVARALTHPQVADLAARASAEVRREARRSPSFVYKTEVTAECWFEDAGSLRAKLESTRARGFGKIGFWRLGQEDPRVWEMIGRKPPETPGEKGEKGEKKAEAPSGSEAQG